MGRLRIAPDPHPLHMGELPTEATGEGAGPDPSSAQAPTTASKPTDGTRAGRASLGFSRHTCVQHLADHQVLVLVWGLQ